MLKDKEYYSDPFRGPYGKHVQRNHVKFLTTTPTKPSVYFNNAMTSLTVSLKC